MPTGSPVSLTCRASVRGKRTIRIVKGWGGTQQDCTIVDKRPSSFAIEITRAVFSRRVSTQAKVTDRWWDGMGESLIHIKESASPESVPVGVFHPISRFISSSSFSLTYASPSFLCAALNQARANFSLNTISGAIFTCTRVCLCFFLSCVFLIHRWDSMDDSKNGAR